MGMRGMGEASAWAIAFARAVAELRGSAGLTVQELADRIGKDPSYLYARFKGTVPFNMNDWELLARGLGVHPVQIARLASSYLNDDDDIEPVVIADSAELARRLRLVESTPRAAGPDFDPTVLLDLAAERDVPLTALLWQRLRDGEVDGRIPVRVLDVIAEYTGVSPDYLTDLRNTDVVETIEAQLELRSAIREVGAESLLARSVGDVSPSAIRAIAQSLREARRGATN